MKWYLGSCLGAQAPWPPPGYVPEVRTVTNISDSDVLSENELFHAVPLVENVEPVPQSSITCDILLYLKL